MNPLLYLYQSAMTVSGTRYIYWFTNPRVSITDPQKKIKMLKSKKLKVLAMEVVGRSPSYLPNDSKKTKYKYIHLSPT